MKYLKTLVLVTALATLSQSCKSGAYVSGSASSSAGYSVSAGVGSQPPTIVDYGATEASLDNNIGKLLRAIADAEDPEVMDKLLSALDPLLNQKEAIAEHLDRNDGEVG